MVRNLFASAVLSSLILSVVGCTTQPERKGSVITAVQTEDGSFKAVDEDGNEVADSPEADLMLGLLDALRGQDLADDKIWSVDADGNLTHIQSGGICPKEWGEFALVKPTIFQRNGMDVGCNFQSQSLNASFTFYFYRHLGPLEQELEGAVQGIKTRNPTAREVELDSIGAAQHPFIGRAFESSVDGGSVIRNSVLLTEKSGWKVKLRMTYEAEDAIEQEQLAALMLQGQIDRIGRDSIGDNPVHENGASELDT